MRNSIRHLPAVVLLAAVAACGGGGEKASSSAPSLPAAVPTPTTTSASPSTTLVAPTKTSVNESVKVSELEHQITAKTIVRHFPMPDSMAAIRDSRECVLVQLQLKHGGKYTGSVAATDFKVLTDDGGSGYGSNTLVHKEMAAAGYEPLTERISDGKSGTGWVAFVVEPTDSKTLTLEYKRFPMKIIGSGKTIPEKKYEIRLIK